MLDSIKRSVSGLVAQVQRLTVVGNNIANATTPGFKRSEGSFSELLMAELDSTSTPLKPDESRESPLGSEYRPEVVFSQGSLIPTGKSLDFALDGKGFIELQEPSGRPVYVRGGSFSLDATGRIVHSSGANVPRVQIDPKASVVDVNHSGEISVAVEGVVTVVGSLRLVNFVNPAGLESVGQGQFITGVNSGVLSLDKATQVYQGYLEASNVSLVDEMTSLIRAQRAYQANAKSLKTLDDMWERTNAIRR